MRDIDIALCVERLMGVADYGSADTYKHLVQTWRDQRPVPTEAELIAIWPTIEVELDAEDAEREALKGDVAEIKNRTRYLQFLASIDNDIAAVQASAMPQAQKDLWVRQLNRTKVLAKAHRASVR